MGGNRADEDLNWESNTDRRRFSTWVCGNRDLVRDETITNRVNVWERRRWISRTDVMSITWTCTGIAALTIATSFSAYSLYVAAMPPGIYTIFIFLGFLALRHKNTRGLADFDSSTSMFQEMHLILILLLPTTMHILVGGIATSSFVLTWSIMAPAGSIFFCHKPKVFAGGLESRWWQIRVISKLQHAIREISPVMADTNVACLTMAYVAISLATIAVDPYITAIDLPPPALRQVIVRAKSLTRARELDPFEPDTERADPHQYYTSKHN
jgi:hypothetical protein